MDIVTFCILVLLDVLVLLFNLNWSAPLFL